MTKTRIDPMIDPRNASSIIDDTLIIMTPRRVGPRALAYVALLPAMTLAAKKTARAVTNHTTTPIIKNPIKLMNDSIP